MLCLSGIWFNQLTYYIGVILFVQLKMLRFIFILCICLPYVCVPLVCLVPAEVRGECWIPLDLELGCDPLVEAGN